MGAPGIQVTAVHVDDDGKGSDIQRVCGSHWSIEKKNAVMQIAENGKSDAKVYRVDGEQSSFVIYSRIDATGDWSIDNLYLKTTRDSTTTNNLLNLPRCDKKH